MSFILWLIKFQILKRSRQNCNNFGIVTNWANNARNVRLATLLHRIIFDVACAYNFRVVLVAPLNFCQVLSVWTPVLPDFTALHQPNREKLSPFSRLLRRLECQRESWPPRELHTQLPRVHMLTQQTATGKVTLIWRKEQRMMGPSART